MHGQDAYLAQRPTRVYTNTATTEAEQQFATEPLNRKSSPKAVRKYLQAKQFEFPLISQIARDYLAIPATSAPSERVFSMAGNLISKKRTRISSENVRYVLCLRGWGVIVHEDNEPEILMDENWVVIPPIEILNI